MADADQDGPLGSAVIEAANRAEVTALLIRCGYRVYRSEADIDGEDLVVMMPGGYLRRVQLKGRPYVEWKRYGGRDLWMLFPSAPWRPHAERTWFLVPHDAFFAWVKARHGHTPKWGDVWHYPSVGKDLAAYLAEWALRSPGEEISLAENPNSTPTFTFPSRSPLRAPLRFAEPPRRLLRRRSCLLAVTLRLDGYAVQRLRRHRQDGASLR